MYALTRRPDGSNFEHRLPRAAPLRTPSSMDASGPGTNRAVPAEQRASAPDAAVPSPESPVTEAAGPSGESVVPGPGTAVPAHRWKVRLRWAVALLMAAAGVSYSSWVLEFALPGGPNPLTSFLSELAEPDRPFAWIYSTGDTVTGVFALVAGIGGLLVFPRRWLPVIGWVAFAAFGAATIADAWLPLHRCHPDPCPQVDYGLFPQLHQVHALTSTLAVFSIFVTMVALTAAAIRHRRWPLWRDSGLWILGIATVVTAWMLVADNLPGDYALGVAQRIQVGCMSVWLLIAAVRICRAERLVSGGKSGTTGMVGA